MTPHSVRVAFNALEASNANLITLPYGTADDFAVTWTAPGLKGVWTRDGAPRKVRVIGVVDANRSHLGPYGNRQWDVNNRQTPRREDLLNCRFSVALTYPSTPPGHLDEELTGAIISQIYRLDEIQKITHAHLQDNGSNPPSRTTNWVVIQQTARGPEGWMRVQLGHAFTPARSASSALPDIVDDPMALFTQIPRHGLRHNDALPCFKPDGQRIGRTGAELRAELYHGRWVMCEFEMVVWSIKEQGLEAYVLQATRLETINAPPAAMQSLPPSDDDE